MTPDFKDPLQAPVRNGGFLSPFSRPAVAAALVAAVLAAVLLFNRFPEIDIATSALFFEPVPCESGEGQAVCGTFSAASNLTLRQIRNVLHYLPVTLAVLLLAGALFALRRRTPQALSFAKGVFVALASIILCSVVIVNVWLKTFSGRPRPVATDLFGGDLPFVPAGQFTDYCASNCSFVSGEASISFWLVGVAALVPGRWRLAALVPALSIAFFASGLRVAFGAHYLSDVTVAGLLALATFSVLATLAARSGMLAPAPHGEAGPSTAR